ncbi:sensor histidine kinase RegB [Aliiroseovarius subalbicans]|uniref:sensor histidine kinase RegB n=1 Tax=Aliiroseovarius subalbicans TaxID=2925840 RepID=UPI001F59D94F|nr:ActS/PrrB/RegB family redox-sensitive histidine kinase [Aliiroseovarius subalbicans]MCI2400028.1 ActS/PrrB/RegB family redox-sensitive histidine kinase [Aliiroseovarius subalbicans]
MADLTPTLFQAKPEQSWVRLRTLIVLRWVAILGQIVALSVAQNFFHLDLDLGLCAFVVGLSVVANLISLVVYPENTRLNEWHATGMLLFDTAQLAMLLFLTGGLHNPFAMLIVVPVTVAATALSLRATLLIGATTIILATLIALYHVPLRNQMGLIQRMPEIFVFGHWAAVVIAVFFVGLYTRRISSEMQSMSQALLATQMALAREQKLTDLGGVVAAAAHELGTPLATIKLVSSELSDELEGNEVLYEDARLIGEQADRCKVILQSMGRAGKDDLLLRQAPLSAVIDEAAEPHSGRGKEIVIETGGGMIDPHDQPTVLRLPELVHGLRNLIQNAVDFAATTVWVETSWSDSTITLRVIDDGRGYSPNVIGRIGDPFMRRRRSSQDQDQRPEYEGMGLGLFIAKTLLERTGAELSFANGAEPYTGRTRPGQKSGAIAEIVWARGPDGIEADEKTPVLGENAPFAV